MSHVDAQLQPAPALSRVSAEEVPRAFVVEADPAEPVRVQPDGVPGLARLELRFASDLRNAVVIIMAQTSKDGTLKTVVLGWTYRGSL